MRCDPLALLSLASGMRRIRGVDGGKGDDIRFRGDTDDRHGTERLRSDRKPYHGTTVGFDRRTYGHVQDAFL